MIRLRPFSFYKYLIFSSVIHGFGLWLLYSKQIFLHPFFSTFFKGAPESVTLKPSEEDLAFAEENKILQEVFNQIVVLAPGLRPPYDAPLVTHPNLLTPKEETDLSYPSTEIVAELSEIRRFDVLNTIAVPPFQVPSFALSTTAPSSSIAASFPPFKNTDSYIRNLQQPLGSISLDEKLDDAPVAFQMAPLPIFEKEGITVATAFGAPIEISSLEIPLEKIALLPPDALEKYHPSLSFTPIDSPYLNLLSMPTTSLKPSSSILQSLALYGFPKIHDSFFWGDRVEVDVLTAKNEDGKYLFSISLTPKFDIAKKKMRQNYYFLIDRSNSIDRYRYETYKRAVARALHSMEAEDRFNIVVFDSKIAAFSPHVLPCSVKNIRAAESFLEKQPHGSYFTATDLYEALPRIIPTEVEEGEAHSVILISDGNSSRKAERQQKMLRSWLQEKQNRVAIYTATAGKSNNLATLELLSLSNHGRLLYSDTHTSFPRKLAKLVLDLKNPVGIDMEAYAAKTDPLSNVELFVDPSALPPLFNQKPFTIYGMADDLTEFTLLVQGKNKSEPLMIEKKISLKQGKAGGRLLAAQWNKLLAQTHFISYVQNGLSSDFKQAHLLLTHDSPNSRR